MRAPDSTEAYRCSVFARWLPRAVAGSLLAAVLMVALDVDPRGVVWGSNVFKGLLGAFGGVLALWIVRRGSELRTVVRAGPLGVSFEHGRGRALLRYGDLQELDWSSPLGTSRTWLPATLLVERTGRVWRLPALLQRGDRLIAELLEQAGRDDLRAWAHARGLARRMGRAATLTAVGYAVAGGLGVLAAFFHLR